MQAAAVADGFDLVHDLLDRPERRAREPVADHRRARQDHRRDEQHGPEQRRRTERDLVEGGGHENAADLGAGPFHPHGEVPDIPDRRAQIHRARLLAHPQRVELVGEPFDIGRIQRARDVGERENLAGGVGHDQVVADGIEVGADPGIECGPGPGGRYDAAEDVVRLAEPAVGEIGLQQEPLVQLPHARRPPLQVKERAEGEHGNAQRDRVPEGEPPADGGHLTPLRRTPRPAPCAPASARAPSRPSCEDG